MSRLMEPDGKITEPEQSHNLLIHRNARLHVLPRKKLLEFVAGKMGRLEPIDKMMKLEHVLNERERELVSLLKIHRILRLRERFDHHRNLLGFRRHILHHHKKEPE